MPNASASYLIRYGIITVSILFVFATSIERVNATIADPGYTPPQEEGGGEGEEGGGEGERGDEEERGDEGERGDEEEVPGFVEAQEPLSGGGGGGTTTLPGGGGGGTTTLPGGGGGGTTTLPGGGGGGTTTLPGGGSGDRIFRSITDGFELQVPAGWIVEDIDNTNIIALTNEEQAGYAFLARICSQDNAFPLMDGNGAYRCNEESTTTARIMRFSDLHERPEFLSLENRYINTSDLLSYYIQFWQRIGGISSIEIWNNTDRTVNIASTQTNQTVSTIPGKLVEYTYTYGANGNTPVQYREFSLLVLNGTTGYSLLYEETASSLPSGRPPSQVQQIFDSFGLLTNSSRGEGALKG